MKKIFLFIAIISMTLTFAQTSKAETNKIIKEQSDGIITPAQKGVTTVYQDGTAVVKTVYNDAKSLSPKIEKALKSLATELKTTANALWDILVRQQLVWSIAILLGLIGTILSWIHFWYRFKIACDNHWGKNGSAHYELICLMCAVISIGGSVLVVMHFNDMLTGFINPEFGALKTIAELAIKLK